MIDPAAFARRRGDAVIGRVSGESMGTTWRAAVTGARPDAIVAVIGPVLDRIVQQMSHWSPTSDLSRFNTAPVGTWLGLATDFSAVIDDALLVARQTSGAFDPAAGALVDLWGHGPPGPRPAPDASTVARAVADGGWRSLEWDRPSRRLRRLRPVRLDLSGIAKGYAIDAACEALNAAGLPDHLVEIGGEARGGGIRPDGQPWWVAVEPVPGTPTAPLRIAACGIAVATSGDYVRGGHSIDPVTGRPIAHATASVTILHRRCCLADAWATALTVLPPDLARNVATEQALAARIVERARPAAEWLSPALSTMLD